MLEFLSPLSLIGLSLVSIVRRVNAQRLDDNTSQSLLTEDRLKSLTS